MYAWRRYAKGEQWRHVKYGKGTRLAVEFVIDLLAQGWSYGDILTNYPGITHEDVLACLAYASERLHQERVC